MVVWWYDVVIQHPPLAVSLLQRMQAGKEVFEPNWLENLANFYSKGRSTTILYGKVFNDHNNVTQQKYTLFFFVIIRIYNNIMLYSTARTKGRHIGRVGRNVSLCRQSYRK